MKRMHIVGAVFGCSILAVVLLYRTRPAGHSQTTSFQLTPKNVTTFVWAKRESKKDHIIKKTGDTPQLPGAAPDWRSLFSSSDDLFAFVKRAAGPAYHGDGNAALYVARAAEICQLEVALYGHMADPQAAVQNSFSGGKYEFVVEKQERNLDLCKGFFSADGKKLFNESAFSSLPPKSGWGYLSFTYWLNQAYRDGNPVAQVIHVGNALPGIGNGTDDKVVSEAQSTLVIAVTTGNPEAVFRTGFLMLSGGHGASATDAYAIAIAGCDLGYDCSTDNPLIFGDCAQAGNCPSGEDFQDWATKQIGAPGYARAYELAQQLELAIARGDNAVVAKLVVLSK